MGVAMLQMPKLSWIAEKIAFRHRLVNSRA